MDEVSRPSVASLNQLVEQALNEMDRLKEHIEERPEEDHELKVLFNQCRERLIKSREALLAFQQEKRDSSIKVSPKVSRHLESLSAFLLQKDKVVQEKLGQEVLKTTFWRALTDFQQLLTRLDSDSEGENLIRVVKVDQDPLT